MKKQNFRRYVGIGVILTASSGTMLAPFARGADTAGPQGSVFTVDNESGTARTISVTKFPIVAEDNPFFQDLGVNGRRCVTCHQPAENMTVSATGRLQPAAQQGAYPRWVAETGRRGIRADRS